jgi:OCT family organic cation transporter-like MFS transporter 4/5
MYIFGFFSLGRASVGYLYMQELLPTKQQTAVGTLLQVVNGSVSIIACFYFYFISKYWLWFEIFGFSTNVVVVVWLFWVPQSPKWLMSKKRYKEAKEVLKYIAMINNDGGMVKEQIEAKVEGMVLQGEREDPNSNNEEKRLNGSLKDLIKIRRHVINLAILALVWTASAFNYYLINFLLKSIIGNVFLNTTVSSTSEMIAYIVGGIAYQKVGIHKTLMVAFTISCLGSICLLIWGGYPNAVPFMIMAARFGVSATFNICYLANA